MGDVQICDDDDDVMYAKTHKHNTQYIQDDPTVSLYTFINKSYYVVL